LFLFIFESIGTSELILIGVIALIFLGPRKLPEIARKIGRVMADLRNTTNEFKSTWEREVNFETEERALRTGELPEGSQPVARVNSILSSTGEDVPARPDVKQIDPERMELSGVQVTPPDIEDIQQDVDTKDLNDVMAEKQNWL
jgi:Tat protein translocase TatB subunit